MTANDEQFEDLYGPLAPFSDFKKGDHITYRSEGQTCTGTILWVATATRIGGRDIPVQYIVECDQHCGFPDNIWQSDIVMDPHEAAGQEEPAMVKCPYCGGMHYADQIKFCLNNPHRGSSVRNIQERGAMSKHMSSEEIDSWVHVHNASVNFC